MHYSFDCHGHELYFIELSDCICKKMTQLSSGKKMENPPICKFRQEAKSQTGPNSYRLVWFPCEIPSCSHSTCFVRAPYSNFLIFILNEHVIQ